MRGAPGKLNLFAILRGGDRRSIGRVPEVVAAVLADPTLFGELFEGIMVEDPVVAMRCADAAEKVSVTRPDLLRPFKRALLGALAAHHQQEVQWHVAQMLPRLELTARERARALAILDRYLASPSSIVKTFAMQAMAELSDQAPSLRPRVVRRLRHLTETGTPAMRSRGRRLLDRLGSHRPSKHR
ncbi:MAG: hypothetical protein KJZ47_09235 [Gemmatimonadales bacterium]|nr:hypothetical protein [Gemmatimonadales bacterium]